MRYLAVSLLTLVATGRLLGQTAPVQQAFVPSHAGQEAFASIAEIVAILKNDPATDWSRVNLEALRQHLIDMDEVTMRAEAEASTVFGGIRVVISGTGRTREAIQRVLTAHALLLDAMPEYGAIADTIPTGIRLTVVAKDPKAQSVVTRIRGLGFIGLLTEGSHHQMHHLAIAKGLGDAAHQH
ncbi:MAG: hypothetical protein ABI877_18740 [Gemmatimonadaceae bacterium]